MKYILFFVVCLAFIHSANYFQYRLDVKNEYGTDDPIVLRAGQYTRVAVILQQELIKKSDPDSSTGCYMNIFLNDSKIVSPTNLTVNPNSKTQYLTYIGLICDNDISANEYNFTFSVEENNFFNNNNNNKCVINVNTVKVKIDKTPQVISLIPLQTSLPGGGFSYFRVEESFSNINPINITTNNKNDNFLFGSITIPTFFSESQTSGLIVSGIYGTQKSLKELGDNNKITFELSISESQDSKCFTLNEKYKKLELEIIEGEAVVLNDSIKEAIIYSIENITPKKDKTNNIQLKLKTPVAPLTYICTINAKNINFMDITFMYNYGYIDNTDDYILKFDHLRANEEYYASCMFLSHNLKYSDINFEIKIGNNYTYDIVTTLIASNDINRIPQCAEFNFEGNSEDLKYFGSLAQKHCENIMNKGETMISRIQISIFCRDIQLENLEKQMICVGPDSRNYDYLYKNNDLKINYTESFDKFIEDLKTEEKIKETLHLEGLKVKSVKKYVDDEAPDVNKISLTLVKKDGNKEKNKKSFLITSTNTQPIECYYNDLTVKTYVNFDFEHSKSIKLDGVNSTKTFEVSIDENIPNNLPFNIKLICYNLPGFEVKYETTGVFTAYSYIYDSEEEFDITPNKQIEINCNEEKNRQNPYCLKGQSDSIFDDIVTDLPYIMEEMEYQSKFASFHPSYAFKSLDSLKKEYDSNKAINNKSLSEFLISFNYLLSKIDCSIYNNETLEESEQYKKCRKNKTELFNYTIELIRNNFTSDFITDFIKKGISEDIEMNFKYLLIIINELTINSDCISEGNHELLYNFTFYFQSNFDYYWNILEDFLRNKRHSLQSTIQMIKKDLSMMIMTSLSNLVNIMHYNEIDGYLKNNKTSEKAGLMVNDDGKNIQKGILDFAKSFNEFGNGTYQIGNLMNITIKVIEGDETEKRLRNLKEENEKNDEEEIYNLTEKGVYVKLLPKKMIKGRKGQHTLQFITFESPLVPIIRNESNNENATIRDFISITIYDQEGKIVNISNLPEDSKPMILYNKTHHKNIKHCFFYNESTDDLETDGVKTTDNYMYKGEKYLKCSPEHLTSFTAGDYVSTYASSDSDSNSEEKNENSEDEEGGSKWWVVVLIILAVLIVLFLVLFFVIHCHKGKSVTKEDIEKNFNKNESIELN